MELYWNANAAIQLLPRSTEKPIKFACTDQFRKSVDRFCTRALRQLVVKAIAKKVYGVLDSSLGDERIGHSRRLRVTDYWRVHYRASMDGIILEEFGGHDMRL